MTKLSVVLATYNEQNNIGKCLEAVKEITDEIVIVDGGSIDNTVEIVKEYGALVVETDNPPIFHINKQKALNAAKGEWVLQLDADEVVSKKLANEIMEVIVMNDEEIEEYQKKLKKRNLFLKHQKIIEQRDGRVGNESKEYSAFFIPRLNFFLGKYLRYGGVYPDGVIRLVKKGKAHFPCKSVHEQIQVEGKVGWLENDLLHNADPTFKRYLERNSRYIDLIVGELKRSKAKKSLFLFIDWVLIKPLWWFLLTLIRHKGILDGIQGIIFSFFSALRFPRAYFRYITK
ncbi:MAG: glycosyl transferase protein [uncultured bacterium]|uniref:Glycosyl transferase family 2 n=2 Tax=Candidatus Daviesiibacteriota TaxID=1752718 RepID=A0A0G0EU17_9BACT|nr:MAG: glycosyl transferase protein [uncultured bacterium]KKQ10373.1 MAG: Glycosyl transferase family 2 [Candidatus Daviesbacteria bacterium GW2011_GWB1_36_5]OGE17799.1 MAG: hypothetical protein A2858_03580 [Candidatus Daviesbacteria bacterium RIFCSPHIGHO2_01_FULL_36_37]